MIFIFDINIINFIYNYFEELNKIYNFLVFHYLLDL